MYRLKKIGKITPKCSKEVELSRFGIGFEKLDRDLFDPEKAYDKVAALGAKWIRLQSGWERTEKAKGVYDFDWLDKVVDNLLKRGLIPWICLCYGNKLYSKAAENVFGSVGIVPIFTNEERNGWCAYATALAEHFKGRVNMYEIWNEPDNQNCWRHGVSGKEYGEFAIMTAKALKAGDNTAKIVGCATCYANTSFINEAFQTGMYQYIDYVSFHAYTCKEAPLMDRVRALRALCDMYKPELELIQGECGTQSKPYGSGALKEGGWTEHKQTKYVLSHKVADLINNVKFTSYFSALDMVEALHGTLNDADSFKDQAYFGLLAAEFDENGRSTGTYHPKPSYYALQNLCSVFGGEFESCDLPIAHYSERSQVIFDYDCTDRSIITGAMRRKNGSFAYVYWNATPMMSVDFEGTVTMTVSNLNQALRLIDPYDGGVYEIPECIKQDLGNGSYNLHHLPIKDYPLILTFGDFCDYE